LSLRCLFVNISHSAFRRIFSFFFFYVANQVRPARDKLKRLSILGIIDT
jgi:hypothetical protein